MSGKRMSRRQLLKALGLAAAGVAAAACQPKTVIVEKEKVITQVVKETVKETVVVEGTPKVVEKQVTKVVEKVVTATPPPEPPIKLTVAGWSAKVFPEADNYIEKEVEKAFNVDLEMWIFERWTAREQLVARIAGGTPPDAWSAIDQPFQPKDGVLAKVPIETIAEYAPNYVLATIDFDVRCWLGTMKRDPLTKEWTNYGVANIYPRGRIGGLCDGWRKDSLDAAGISETPKTVEEFEQAMEAMVNKGIHPYGTRVRWGDSPQMAFGSLYGAYGTFPLHWIPNEQETEVVFGFAHPGTRRALETIRRWWDKGLIHPESPTSKWKQLVNGWCAGEHGFFDVGTWTRFIPGGELYDCIVDEGGEVEMAWAPKGPDGYYGYHTWGVAVNGAQLATHMEYEDKKLQKYLEMVDTLTTNERWATFVRFGEEGKHSFRDEYGALRLKPEDELPEPLEKIGLGSQIWGAFASPSHKIWWSWQRKDLPQILERVTAKNIKYIPELGRLMDWDVCKEYTEVSSIYRKALVDFGSGARPLSEWDAALNEWLENGGQCITDEANKAYQDMGEIIKEVSDLINKLLK